MTGYSRSVIDLIRAQMVGAVGRTRTTVLANQRLEYSDIVAWGLDAIIFAPHGGEALDSRRTAKSYVAA